jgi:hypothetical protein
MFGVFALFMLIVTAVRFRVDVVHDFSWWLAVVGAIGAIVIPQVLFPWLWKRQDSDRSWKPSPTIASTSPQYPTQVLNFCTKEACLKLDTSNVKWWRATVDWNNQEQVLGAEVPKYITEHLIRSLSVSWADLEGPVNQTLGGYQVKWVLSLAEGHSTLYVASEADDRILIWQDRDAKIILTMHVAPELAATWRNQLRIAFQAIEAANKP